jgi:hypothetical protein
VRYHPDETALQRIDTPFVLEKSVQLDILFLNFRRSVQNDLFEFVSMLAQSPLAGLKRLEGELPVMDVLKEPIPADDPAVAVETSCRAVPIPPISPSRCPDPIWQ